LTPAAALPAGAPDNASDEVLALEVLAFEVDVPESEQPLKSDAKKTRLIKMCAVDGCFM
jgi:hypothetical protein